MPCCHNSLALDFNLSEFHLPSAIHQWPTLFAIPHLKASRGAIVVVSSMYGLLTAPYQTAYSASKHALSGFFDSLRPELAAHGVSITLHHPGGVATEVTSKVPAPALSTVHKYAPTRA
jgi:short-subunit dehydrogenase